MKCIVYTIETEKRENDEVHPKLIMGENGKREEEEGGQEEDEEGDRGGEYNESIGEEPKSKNEGDQHQLEDQRVGEEEQEFITTQEGENSIIQ